MRSVSFTIIYCIAMAIFHTIHGGINFAIAHVICANIWAAVYIIIKEIRKGD